ncbi:SET domain-containing protein 5 [Aspergillus viridinutans]|uniref:SET domain-containing protein 5 n=1 Tax=Aspergillus viridinutans TaxID=75553 RepID=A0A9P3C7M2_ASPVI|nr:SET domain-containing protein 5 [Aspergillus viridinutans]GIK06676.1 SET domain-containing protein 5 [Aspergillus viridinutans]
MRNAALNAIVQNSRQRITVNVEKEAFGEVQIPGKGVGVVAKRSLHKGDLLISEPPSLVVHLDMRAAVPEKQRLRMQLEGVDRLPLLTKSETMGLMGHWGGDPVEDILDTNSFTVTVHAANDHHALFIQTSVSLCFLEYIAHMGRYPDVLYSRGSIMIAGQSENILIKKHLKCLLLLSDSCMYTFDPKTFTQNMYTIRDISPGEELTISYIDPTVTHKERQEAISFWGFNCSCHTCTMSPEAIEQSDERIQRINRYKKLLNDWSTPQNNATPEMARTLVDLYTKENLWCHIADGYRLAAHAYNAVRDRGNALRMANLAFGYGLQAWRYMGRKMIDMLDLMTSPEEHWTWGQRVVIDTA